MAQGDSEWVPVAHAAVHLTPHIPWVDPDRRGLALQRWIRYGLGGWLRMAIVRVNNDGYAIIYGSWWPIDGYLKVIFGS